MNYSSRIHQIFIKVFIKVFITYSSSIHQIFIKYSSNIHQIFIEYSHHPRACRARAPWFGARTALGHRRRRGAWGRLPGLGAGGVNRNGLLPPPWGLGLSPAGRKCLRCIRPIVVALFIISNTTSNILYVDTLNTQAVIRLSLYVYRHMHWHEFHRCLCLVCCSMKISITSFPLGSSCLPHPS